MVTEIPYLYMRVADAKDLLGHLEKNTAWAVERRDVAQWVDLANHHNWGPDVNVLWRADQALGKRIEEAAQFFEISFEIKGVQVGSGVVK